MTTSAFQKLALELETLAKALPAEDGKDDKKIQAAAADGGGGDGGEKTGDDPDDKDDPMAKSFEITLADGSKTQAVDGTELVKSLVARIDVVEKARQETEVEMAKSLGMAVTLIKSQSEMVKSLQAKVDTLSATGTGRKAVVAIHEKTASTLAKSEQQEGQMTNGEFLAKSESAFNAGKISGQEFTMIDVSLRQNSPIDPSLINKVITG